jgi:hypothetical protein
MIRRGMIAVALLAALGPAARSQSPAYSADDLLAEVRVGATTRSAAKPDGAKFAVSAARFAEVKHSTRQVRFAAKPIDGRISDGSIPDWLQPTPREQVAEWLTKVPEVGLTGSMKVSELTSIASQFGKDHSEKVVERLARERPDLAGLPFRLGSLCRLPYEQCQALGATSQMTRAYVEAEAKGPVHWRDIRIALRISPAAAARAGDRADNPKAMVEFDDLRLLVHQMLHRPQDVDEPLDRKKVPVAPMLPGLMQILAVQAPKLRLEIVKMIEAQPPGDDVAIAALVRLALFDEEPEVRTAAVGALRREDASKYTSKLFEGLRYPWHVVAERAADAIVALERTDLIYELIRFLEEPDPADPIEVTMRGERVLAVREVVKINHHRNCILCHAATTSISRSSVPGVTARIPSIDEPLPPLSSRAYYDHFGGVPTVHADETYLRQDFSTMMPVADPGPWPKMQRFDFIVRTRVLTPSQQAELAEKKASDPPTPHRRAALLALTRLTSAYLGPEARDWRSEALRRLAEKIGPAR